MSTWPSALSSLTDPNPTQRLNNPSHSSIESNQNDAVEKLENYIGLASGASASALGTLIGAVMNLNSDGGGHIQTAAKGGTGQTSYAKGTILVGQNASTLTKLAVGGTDGYALIVNSGAATGVSWGIPNNVPTMRVYNPAAAVIWEKPSNLSYAVVEIQAPGGAGNSGTGDGSGGGGAGAYVRRIIPASSLPVAASVLVRAGGTGSLISYFGSLLQVTGGTTATADDGGAGGSVLLSGNLNINGQAGQSGGGTGNPTQGAAGGNSFMGSGGAGGPWTNATGTASNGQAGILGGGGGGQTPATDGSPDGNGGAGGDGIAIIYEY